jgi:microcystin-dependent protein
MFGGNFAPRGWALCDGQLLAVSQNDALFSLLGTIYGGDGRTTFGLPDLRGRLPIHAGQGPGLSNRQLGSKSGTETETLTVAQIPAHDHDMFASTEAGNTMSPGSSFLANTGRVRMYRATSGTNVTMHANTLANAGGSQGHTNLMPSLCVNFIIALVGIYPSRT